MTLVEPFAVVPRYDIVVRSRCGEERVYRTTRSLFDGGADDVISKGTRVWEVLQVDIESGATIGEPVVLKDSWVGRHREREGDILARIRESTSALNPEDRARLEDSLVTVIHHGDVYIADQIDYARLLPRKGTRSFCNLRQDRRRVDAGQVHYRAVYQESGRPLHTESSLAKVYAAVAEVCRSMSSVPWIIRGR